MVRSRTPAAAGSESGRSSFRGTRRHLLPVIAGLLAGITTSVFLGIKSTADRVLDPPASPVVAAVPLAPATSPGSIQLRRRTPATPIVPDPVGIEQPPVATVESPAAVVITDAFPSVTTDQAAQPPAAISVAEPAGKSGRLKSGAKAGSKKSRPATVVAAEADGGGDRKGGDRKLRGEKGKARSGGAPGRLRQE